MYKLDTLQDAYLYADLFDTKDIVLISYGEIPMYTLMRPSSNFSFKRGDKIILSKKTHVFGNSNNTFLDRDELAKELFENKDRWLKSLNSEDSET